ncbi:exonuclease domain-containing protein [Ditylenchus destructor]|nr:exonuclease domain-containing protein [Ditylenchus destructor]
MASWRKQERVENRIRKRAAELMLLNGQTLEEEEEIKAKRIKEDESISELHGKIEEKQQALKELSAELTKSRMEKAGGPQMFLTLAKLNGRLLRSVDFAGLIHYFLIGSFVQRPKWINFKNLRGFLQVVLLRVNCRDNHLESEQGQTSFIDSYFERHWIKLDVSTLIRDEFWKGIANVKQSKLLLLKKKITENGDPLEALRGKDIKQELLLSLEQMVDHRYPLGDEFDENGTQIHVQPTKTWYRKVSKDSPIFVLDCEMCITTAKRSELTRISIVNEEGEVLLDTYVMPKNEITDYVTKFSGITKEKLKGVKVTLQDVQRAISSILPPDGILCGHSLEFDLRALGLSHPFCIDLALLYNFSGNARSRSSLRTLSSIFLREDIQNSKAGHCSVEDALATLKLLRLKMNNGIAFGNVIYGFKLKEYTAANGMDDFGRRPSIDSLSTTDKESGIKTEDETIEEQESETTQPKIYESKLGCIENFQFEDEPCPHDKTTEIFDFESALKLEKGCEQTIKLSKSIASCKDKNVLLAIDNPEDFVEQNESCKLMNTGLCGPSYFQDQVAPQLIEHSVSLVEANLDKKTSTTEEINSLVKAMIDGTCVNGLFLLVMAAKTKSILYTRMKK